jgi:hypothetical protein
MTLEEIKNAVNSCKKVFYGSLAYEVVVNNKGEWLIKCTSNGYAVGLTWADDVTMNGKESDFYTL